MTDLSVYNDEFYDLYGHEAAKMAPWFMPLLLGVIPFRSFVDVGCGEGHYVKWAIDKGIDADGIEGSSSAVCRSLLPLMPWDLRTPWKWKIRYDLALSLEVAEHIEPEFAGVFVDTLCALSDIIVMTAAPPGQGGLQHVNEQPREYWDRLFSERRYRPAYGELVDLQAGIRHSMTAST